MNERSKQLLGKYFLTVLVLFMLSALLVSAQLFVKPRTEAKLRSVAAESLASLNAGSFTVKNHLSIENAGLLGSWAFEVIQKGKKTGIAFIIPVMGNSGPYTGVFYWKPEEGAQFCSLVGVEDGKNNPEIFGITERVLNACERQLNAIAIKSGVLQ
jgi:hypothetical protein